MWMRIQTDIKRHEKIRAATRDLQRQKIYFADLIVFSVVHDAIAYAAERLTDGFVPDDVIRSFAHVVERRQPDRPRIILAALERVGLLHRDEARGGWVVHDYLDYQPASEDVKTRRAETRDRVARHRSRPTLGRQLDDNRTPSVQTVTALHDQKSSGKPLNGATSVHPVTRDHVHDHVNTKDKEHARDLDRDQDAPYARARVLTFRDVSKQLTKAAYAVFDSDPKVDDVEVVEAMKVAAAKMGASCTLEDLTGVVRSIRLAKARTR